MERYTCTPTRTEHKKTKTSPEYYYWVPLCAARSSRCLKTTTRKVWKDSSLLKVTSSSFLPPPPPQKKTLFLTWHVVFLQHPNFSLWPTTLSNTFWVRTRGRRSTSSEVSCWKTSFAASPFPIKKLNKDNFCALSVFQRTGRRFYWSTLMPRSCRWYTGANWQTRTGTLAVEPGWAFNPDWVLCFSPWVRLMCWKRQASDEQYNLLMIIGLVWVTWCNILSTCWTRRQPSNLVWEWMRSSHLELCSHHICILLICRSAGVYNQARLWKMLNRLKSWLAGKL